MKYLKFIVFLLCCGIFNISNAQKIIYFDQNWNVVKDKKQASYYREAKKENKHYHIKDFYMSGTLQMEGYSLNNDPEQDIFDGKVVWYNEQGKSYNIAHYKEGVLNGVYQYYGEDGTLLTDLVYDKGKPVSGYITTLKRKSKKDTINFNTYNYKVEYLGNDKVKSTVYDDDINGIRKIEYINAEGTIEKQEFYNEKNQKIGEANYKSYMPDDTVVGFYFEPMRVRSIETFSEHKPDPYTKKFYYTNGQLKSSYLLLKPDKAQETFYNMQGKQIGFVTYNKTSADYTPVAYNGTRINFNVENEDLISSIYTLKDGYHAREEIYHNNGNMKSIKNFGPTESTLDETYFDESGKQIAKIIYKDGNPFDGLKITDTDESEYKKGLLLSEKRFNKKYGADNKPIKHLFFERKLIGEVYKGKVYSKTGEHTHDIEIPKNSNIEYEMNGTIISYKNGKTVAKAIVTQGKLTSGAFYRTAFYDEFWKSEGSWFYKEYYRNGELIFSSKVKEDLKTFEKDEYYPINIGNEISVSTLLENSYDSAENADEPIILEIGK